MSKQIEIKRVEPSPIAVVRLRAKSHELSRVIPDACGEVWNFLRANQIKGAGRHIAIYFDGQINIECGAEVANPFQGNGRVICSSSPAGMVATTAHFGPYQRLGEAHEAITQWCAAQHLQLAGPNWEIYGHWTDDETQLRTDVFYLLRDSVVAAG